ncbi:MAG: glycosyltransferase [Lachnospiraceae bacterium]|nr:glycosyltransferase [Lachnospiraceae bacterium]
MKVLLVNKFHYIKGGSETYYFGLGELLKKHGCEVIYFSMKDEKNFPCEQEKYFVGNVDFNAPMGKLQTIKAAIKMLYSFEAKKKFEQLIQDEKPDIIHLNIFQSQLTGSIVDVAKKYKIPVVYTAHDLKSVCPNYQMLNHTEVCEKCLHGNYTNCFKTGCMKDSKLKSLLATLEAYVYKIRKTYQKMDLIITPSAFYKKKIEEAGIAKCPVVHMPNFLPEGTEYGCKREGGDYFLYFGRLSREKGILTLVKAYKEAQVDKPLYIVGTGPVKEQIEALIEQEGLQDKVKLLGFKSGQELKDIIANALCVCLPSEWYENGPYTIMEAQAAGKPVIVSGYGGLPELVEDGVTGYVAKAGDVKDLAEKMSMASKHSTYDSQRIIEKSKNMFHPTQYDSRLIDLYQSLL